MERQTGRGSGNYADQDSGEMLIPPRTWTRIGDPVNLCVRKNLTLSKRPFLWMLLILLLLCLVLQTFVTSSDRSNRNLGPAPKSVWEDIQSSGNQDTRPQQTGRADPPRQSKGHGKPPDENLLSDVDKMLNLYGASETERRKVTPELPDPSYPILHSTRKTLTTEQRLVHATPPTVHATTTCHPQSHVVFLKTHKTASSTILNILYRYGESRNLTFALPANKHSQLFYPSFFASQFVEGVSSRSLREFHIMCNHMRFRKAEVAKVMPEDTFYFSILRHPVTMMESVFTYYNSIQAFHKTRSLDDFLDNSRTKYNASVYNNHYAHNILAFDFGFDNNVTADTEDLEDKASRAIAAIERDFHLILISEYFDESMILLKHALCWSLEDMASFKLNTRSNKTRHQISLNTTEKIKRWNALDWRIYLHFNATFWHKVDSLVGQEQMKSEVSQLRDLQVKLTNTCLKEGGAVDPSQVKDAQLKPFQYGAAIIQGYNLNPDLDTQTRTQCQRLITPELQYTEHLYSQQFPAKHKQVKRMIPPQHQCSGRTDVMGVVLAAGARHRQVIRHKFSNPKNQNTTSALSTIANNKPSLS